MVTVSVKAPSVSSLIKYSTSKLTGVQNYKSQLVPIGLVNLPDVSSHVAL